MPRSGSSDPDRDFPIPDRIFPDVRSGFSRYQIKLFPISNHNFPYLRSEFLQARSEYFRTSPEPDLSSDSDPGLFPISDQILSEPDRNLSGPARSQIGARILSRDFFRSQIGPFPGQIGFFPSQSGDRKNADRILSNQIGDRCISPPCRIH